MDTARLHGRFIVFDGPDGAGKSTQVRLAAEALAARGLAVTTVRDPGGTVIGEQIRAILLDRAHHVMSVRCETLLYMASRAQLYAEIIAPVLAAGGCVLSDRWVSSTYAYQAVAGAMGAEQVLQIAEAALERTWPDLTVLLDLPSATGLGRVGRQPDRMEAKGDAFHERVRRAFLDLAGHDLGHPVSVVDAQGEIEAVHQRVMDALQRYVDA